MAKRKLYGNILDIPLSPTLAATLIKGAEFAAKQNHEELEEREKALFNYYGLKRPEFIDLTTRSLIKKLAIDNGIIGFIEKSAIKKPGRPNKWYGETGILLYAQTKLMLLKYPGISLRDAINRTRTKYKYKEDINSLYTRYNEIIKNNHSSISGVIELLNNFFAKNILTKEQNIENLSKFIEKHQK